MKLPDHKTKIVCTIGPASESPEIMERMIRAGMDVARLNFSHGDFPGHKRVIENLRAAARAAGRRLAILADLPGPKIRIGQFSREPVELKAGDRFILTTDPVPGTAERVGVSLPTLPQSVKAGDRVFLNDGFIELEVLAVQGKEVACRVVVGGELRSRKGLNLPGIDLGITAFTDNDRRCLQFALENGVDAVSQSFVESGQDLAAVRRAAASFGASPFLIAKIERSRALTRMEEILEEADGIMIARGSHGNPWIFREARAALNGEPAPPEPDVEERFRVCLEHARNAIAFERDPQRAILDFRKHLGWYTRGLPDGKRLRMELFQTTTLEQVEALLESYLAGQGSAATA